jgi:hypothetical protein
MPELWHSKLCVSDKIISPQRQRTDAVEPMNSSVYMLAAGQGTHQIANAYYCTGSRGDAK